MSETEFVVIRRLWRRPAPGFPIGAFDDTVPHQLEEELELYSWSLSKLALGSGDGCTMAEEALAEYAQITDPDMAQVREDLAGRSWRNFTAENFYAPNYLLRDDEDTAKQVARRLQAEQEYANLKSWNQTQTRIQVRLGCVRWDDLDDEEELAANLDLHGKTFLARERAEEIRDVLRAMDGESSEPRTEALVGASEAAAGASGGGEASEGPAGGSSGDAQGDKADPTKGQADDDPEEWLSHEIDRAVVADLLADHGHGPATTRKLATTAKAVATRLGIAPRTVEYSFQRLGKAKIIDADSGHGTWVQADPTKLHAQLAQE